MSANTTYFLLNFKSDQILDFRWKFTQANYRENPVDKKSYTIDYMSADISPNKKAHYFVSLYKLDLTSAGRLWVYVPFQGPEFDTYNEALEAIANHYVESLL